MDRAPVVCLPGFLGDARVFEPFVALARARYDVVALDLPPGGLDEAAMALPEIEGHYLTGSFGGLVASRLPSSRLRSLAMVGTLPSPRRVAPGIGLVRRLVDRTPDRVLERMYRAHCRRALELDGVRLGDPFLEAGTLRERLRSVCAWPGGFPAEVRTLWVLGATDHQAPSSAEVLLDQPHADVVHVPGGHRPYASHPGPLLTELERFWSCVG